MAKGDDGCLKGCAIGCAGILVLALGASAFGYYKFVRPVQVSLERVAEMNEESGELDRRLEELDVTYEYEAPEDAAAVVLEEEDVERYLAVRSAVADELAAFVEAREGFEDRMEPEEGEEGGFPGFRALFSAMFASFDELSRTKLELQRAALEALESQRMSPRELETLLGLVEWRFLGRDEASFFGLSPDGREMLLQQQRALRASRRMLGFAERFNAEVEGRSAEELRAEIERFRRQISVLQDGAGGNRELHRRTRAVLEEHRGALQELGTEGLDVLATLTEQELEEAPLERLELGR